MSCIHLSTLLSTCLQVTCTYISDPLKDKDATNKENSTNSIAADAAFHELGIQNVEKLKTSHVNEHRVLNSRMTTTMPNHTNKRNIKLCLEFFKSSLGFSWLKLGLRSCFLDEICGILHSNNGFCTILIHTDFELLLQGHHNLYLIQRIGTQLLEFRVRLDTARC